MLLILASRFDDNAARLAQRWQDQDARVLTCQALSRRGWRFDPARPRCGALVLDEEPVAVDRLRGMLCLLPAVYPSELPHIEPGDREYVAAEMTAFLVAWLTSLPCPVLGRPTPLSLTGPLLRQEQWLREAARAGLPVQPRLRRLPAPGRLPIGAPAGPPDEAPATAVALVAGQPVPAPNDSPPPASITTALAAMACAVGATLLTAHFGQGASSMTFTGATTSVDVQLPEVADAMLAAFTDQAHHR